MENKKVLIAVAIPFILLCMLIARAEYHVRTGEQWQFEITGYDPRDPLRGHYLRFTTAYDWDTANNKCDIDQTCCLCLTKTQALVPKVHKDNCTIVKTQCDGFMQSEYHNTLDRFYIAESNATRAENILRQAHMDRNAYLSVSINIKGEPKIVDLLIGEQSIDDILKTPAAN